MSFDSFYDLTHTILIITKTTFMNVDKRSHFTHISYHIISYHSRNANLDFAFIRKSRMDFVELIEFHVDV